MTQAKIGGQDVDGVVLIDATTGLPYNAGSGGSGGGSSVYTLGVPVAVAVAAVDTLLIAANPNRKKLIIQVNGAADVALSFGAGAATLAAGLMLSASDNGAGYAGGSITVEHTGAVRGIGRAASSVSITEGT